MERINTPEVPSFMLRNGKITSVKTCSELGIFSSVMFDTDKNSMLENRNLGILFRTKGTISNEGGVNSGYSVIDNPFLAEINDLNNIKPLVNDV